MLEATGLRTSPARGMFFLLSLTVQAHPDPPHPKLFYRGHKSNIYRSGTTKIHRGKDWVGRPDWEMWGHTGAGLSCLKGQL